MVPLEHEHSARAFVDAQNAVRGVLSNARPRRIGKRPSDPEQRLVVGLSRALLDARAALRESQFDDFLSWATAIFNSLLGGGIGKPGHFLFLGGFPSVLPKVSLSKELSWISTYLKHNADSVNRYVNMSADIEEKITSGYLQKALLLIDEVNNQFGNSFWSVQLKIAVEQLMNGLEAQKTYIEFVRRRHTRGVLSYISFFTGVRNEERTTWTSFVDSVQRSVDGTKYEDGLKNYLKFKLTLAWPDSEAGISDVLRYEQCANPIDIYETFLSAAQHIIAHEDYRSLQSSLKVALDNLSPVRDFRIEKLRFALGLDSATLPRRDSRASNYLLQQRPRAALRAARTGFGIDPWKVIYGAIARAHYESEGSRSRKIAQGLEHLLASILRRDAESILSAGQAEKITKNLSGIPLFAGLDAFVAALSWRGVATGLPVGNVGLYSRFLGNEDLDLPVYRDGGDGWLADGSAAGELWKALTSDDGQTDAIHKPFSEFMLGVRAMRRKAHLEAIAMLQEAMCTTNCEPLARAAAVVLLECYMAVEDRSNAIRLVAREAATNEVAPDFLPIERALGGLRWPTFKAHTSDLSAQISLDTLWRATDRDAVATMLRHSFAYHLQQSGMSAPSQIVDHLEGADVSSAVYYLRNVCVPNIMDMAPQFATSRAVVEERQNVCAALIGIDPDRADEYTAEIYDITNRFAVVDGLKLVDRSRIHVDTDAITRWARRNVEEDFGRYCDLIKIGKKSEGDFEDVLRELFANIGARQVFFTPDDQSDGILADMLYLIRNEFLNNSDYGLDYFLSKRVRHQSFIGLIRGPLEFADVITSRETEFGSYKPNVQLLEKLSGLTVEEKSKVQECLWAFSQRFDATLVRLKDNQLQIRSPEAPDGLFDIELTQRMLFIVRNVMQTGFGFDDFLRMVYKLFWGSLEPSLSDARQAIGVALKSELRDMLDELRAVLHEIAGTEPAFAELSSAIVAASAEVQRNLDDAARWFLQPEGQPVAHNFTLAQSLEIAIESARKSHRAFEPLVTTEINGDMDLETPDMLLLTDAIFVALDNIKAHSLLKKPKVSISCNVDAGANLISLEVRNQVASSVDQRAADEKLGRLRALIESGEVSKRARREGGSGFLKIAAALRHSANGKIEFGFEGAEFFFKVELTPARYTVAVYQVG